jgi:hypothetical protein
MYHAFFAFLVTLICLGAFVLVVMLIVRGVNQRQRARQEMFNALLAKGVYDYRLLKGRSGNASLGWGITFVAVGVAILIGLARMPDPMIVRHGAIGGFIPLFIGLGLIIFYVISNAARRASSNGEPIQLRPPETPTAIPRTIEEIGGDE